MLVAFVVFDIPLPSLSISIARRNRRSLRPRLHQNPGPVLTLHPYVSSLASCPFVVPPVMLAPLEKHTCRVFFTGMDQAGLPACTVSGNSNGYAICEQGKYRSLLQPCP